MNAQNGDLAIRWRSADGQTIYYLKSSKRWSDNAVWKPNVPSTQAARFATLSELLRWVGSGGWSSQFIDDGGTLEIVRIAIPIIETVEVVLS